MYLKMERMSAIGPSESATLDGRIVITITFAAHGDLEAMLTQGLLVVMRTVLAAPVAMEDAACGWRSEGDGHFQSPDRQVTLHASADSPTNHTLRMQIEDHRQIQPDLTRPDVADVASPFRCSVLRFWFGPAALKSRSSRFGAMLNV